MDLDAARTFLRENHHSILATTRSDGRAQMSPVVHGIDDGGRAIISSRETAYKVRNLRRNPAASLCAFPDGFFGQWIQVDGQADLVSLPEAMDLLVDYYRQLSGEHPDWDGYRAAMVRDRRLVIRISLERAGPDRSG
jgi:PPOX class probable F420-dependent enzyme